MKQLKMLKECRDYKILVKSLKRDTLEYFEETLEEWDSHKIKIDNDINELYHIDGKLFSSDAIRWYAGCISTEDLINEYKDDVSEEDKTLFQNATELLELHPYLKTGEHKDLKAVCVCEYNEEVGEEIMFFIEKEWLANYAKENYEVDDLDYWLQNEYTSDESESILIDGIMAGVVAGILK